MKLLNKLKFAIQMLTNGSIKPSTSTPKHLRRYRFSHLDQTVHSVFMPAIYFYTKEAQTRSSFTNREQLCHRIKESLSEALTLYYPLAGRLPKHKLYVDCNDEGAHYVEAEASCQLSDVLHNPEANTLRRFIPFDTYDVANGFTLIVQVTFFDCVGVSLGVAMNHKMGDALSLFMFVNTWSAIARGQTHIIQPPLLCASKLFPPKDMPGLRSELSAELTKKYNIVTKRFVFDSAKIAALVDRYSNDVIVAAGERRLSRVEAVSTFIWNRFVAATQAKKITTNTTGDDHRIYAVGQVVNIRKMIEIEGTTMATMRKTKTTELVADNLVGNIVQAAISEPIPVETNNGRHYNVVGPMRESMKAINEEFVKKLQQHGSSTDSVEHLNIRKQVASKMKKGEEVVFYAFSSLCNFPLYETDFGWGEPAYVGMGCNKVLNFGCFNDTKLRDGIEAWLNLKEEDMAKFEQDEQVAAMFGPSHLVK